jgi:hypothetical protein
MKVPPRPLGVSAASNFTPSPRKSGKSHQRSTLTPFVERLSSSVATLSFLLTPGWFHLALPPKSAPKWCHA